MIKKNLLAKFPLWIIIILTTQQGSCTKSTPEEGQKEGKLAYTNLVGKKWTLLRTSYWSFTEHPDSLSKKLNAADTASLKNYKIRKVYGRSFTDSLSVEKIIIFNGKSGLKVSETDRYKKRLTEFLESQLDIRYDWEGNNFEALYIDTKGTDRKREENSRKAEETLLKAKKEGLDLCGTMYYSIIWEDIPRLPVPIEISNDTALQMIKHWKKGS